MDLYFFQQINNLAGTRSWLDFLGVFFAEYLGYVLVAILLFFIIKNRKKYWRMVILAFCSAVVSRFVIAEILYWLWFRPRPFVNYQINLLLNQSAAEASFPSGHAAFYFALSFIVYCHNKRAGLWFFIASFLISISRVFCGVHWLSDILGGAIIGILSGWLIFLISKKFKSAESA